MRRERFGHVFLIALCLSAPAFAYTASGVDDAANPGADNPGLDVTRHAMPPPDVTAKPAETPTVAANPLWAIPLSALTATRARPLFTPSRRPPAPVVASVPVAAPRPLPAPPAVPQHPNLTLVGTVAGESEGIAVFVDPTTRDTVRLRTGEGHSGWILQSVERSAATLQKGGQTETLALPRPAAQEGSAPVVTALPPAPMPPPQSPPLQSGASAPAKAQAPQSQGGCMPEPVGC
jgi:general secretion pathway protein N